MIRIRIKIRGVEGRCTIDGNSGDDQSVAICLRVSGRIALSKTLSLEEYLFRAPMQQ